MRQEIVEPSWNLINRANSIKKFNFIPSLISTLYLSVIVLYQISYTYVILFKKKDEFFSLVVNFFHKSYFIEVIIWVAIWLILYLLLQPIAEGWVICMIEWYRWNDEQKKKISYWISQWILNFLQVFEFHNFMWLFKLLSVITFYFLLLRVVWKHYAWAISIVMWIYLIFAIFINLLFAYTRFFIIFEKKRVFEAISLSTKMTLTNIDVTLKLYYTLFLVYARVIFTVVVFTIFSWIFSFLFWYFTTQIYFIFWAVFIWIILFIFILFTSHFNSVLEIFVDALWYNAYLENKKNMLDE